MRIVSLVLISAALVFAACKSPQEKVVDENIEAAQEIGEAEENLAETARDVQKDIDEADPQDSEEEKIEATREMADAEKEVDEEKIEATEEIVDAEQKAGAGGSYQKE